MRRWSTLITLLVLIVALAIVYLATPPAEVPSAGAPSPTVAPPTSAGSDGPIAEAGPGPAPAAQSDWYAIYFTEPKYPADPSQYHGGIDERLVQLMDRAQRTLDVAIYDFDLMNVAEAMARAKARGVQVRMVTDSDTVENTKDEHIQAALEHVRGAGIEIVEDRRGSIMHNKFTIVDNEWVSTGSWNYTEGDTYRLNNWMGVFRSKELAETYTAEFEQLFSGKFSNAKEDVLLHPVITIGDSRIRPCFSPEGKCATLVADTIRETAQHSIVFMAFSFTHDDIGQAMLDKAAEGVAVSGVFETTGSQTQFSEFGKLQRAGLDVYTDGNPYVMHHKVIVIDEHTAIVGSFNFSANADEDNDENLLVIEDQGIAQAFQQEFDRVLAVAKNPPQRSKS